MCICSKGAILCLHGNASLLQILLCPLTNTPATVVWPRLPLNLIPSSHQGNTDLEHCGINTVVPSLWGVSFPQFFFILERAERHSKLYLWGRHLAFTPHPSYFRCDKSWSRTLLAADILTCHYWQQHRCDGRSVWEKVYL